jgi:hypothetical protein
MMGERRVDQAALFYEFSLERHVPQDHLKKALAPMLALKALACGAKVARRAVIAIAEPSTEVR